MGIFKSIAASFIRKKILSGLANNCPAELKAPLQMILEDKSATDIIGRFLIDAAKEGGKVRADAITALPFSAAIKELLASTPKLATYIALAARMVGKK